jgi:hypothetical protein
LNQSLRAWRAQRDGETEALHAETLQRFFCALVRIIPKISFSPPSALILLNGNTICGTCNPWVH